MIFLAISCAWDVGKATKETTSLDARLASGPPPNIFPPTANSQSDRDVHGIHLLVVLLPAESRLGSEGRTKPSGMHMAFSTLGEGSSHEKISSLPVGW